MTNRRKDTRGSRCTYDRLSVAFDVQQSYSGVFMKVLIAYDGSRFAEAAIADLANAGLPDDTQARIFHVVERHIDPMSESILEDACTRVQYRFRSWNVQMETAMGTPAE